MHHDIFISYSSKQKSIADGVCHYLEENGFKCWMAPRDIPVGSEYGDLIEEAIKACEVVVLVFSEAASISKWVKGEINVAFNEDKSILPFRVDETEIKGGFRVMLNQMHWIDAYPHYADRLPDLLKSISGLLGRSAKNVNVQGNTPKRNEAIGENLNRSDNPTNSFNGHEYVNLGLPSGTLWAICNVGANKPEDYGDHFAWGETIPKAKDSYKFSKEIKRLFSKNKYLLTKYCNNSEYGYEGFTDKLTVLQAFDDAATANWGDGWRMPSIEQWKELKKNTKSTWTTRNGVNGWLFTANNGNSLFLPAAGECLRSSHFDNGRYGWYWSSSLYKDYPPFAWRFLFNSGNCYTGSGDRYRRMSIRAVRSMSQN